MLILVYAWVDTWVAILEVTTMKARPSARDLLV
jgi:hypothetical protein